MNSVTPGRAGNRRWIVLVFLIGTMSLVWLGARPASDAFEAVRILVALGEGPDGLEVSEIVRESVSWPVGEDEAVGDYYPGNSDAPTPLLLIYGAAPGGKDDPRVVAFAMTLADAGFNVLIPDIPTIQAMQLGPANIDDIANAALFFPACRGEGGQAVGLVAVSYAVGPAVLAARREEVDGCLSFVVGLGGYYDLVAATTFFTTGYYRASETDPWAYREPNDYSKWVFVYGNTDRIDDAGDRYIVSRIARRKLGDYDADIDDLVAQLGPEGLAIITLITNEDPALTGSLLADISPGITDDMAALDLAGRDLSLPRSPLILIHGRDDPIIPYTQTLSLAAARGEAPVHVYIVDNLAHVELTPGGIDDFLVVWRAFYRILSLR